MYSKRYTIILSSLLILLITMIFISYRLNKNIDELDKRIDDLRSTKENYILSMDNMHEQLSLYKLDYENKQHDSSIQQPKNDDPDLKILSQLIESEAGTQSFEGKLAVGTVVMNRVESGKFPNNVRDVIFQKNQFSVIGDGKINNEPSDESVRAAKTIMEGTRVLDKDVLYFYNPKLVKVSNWIRGRKTTKIIGDHAFAI